MINPVVVHEKTPSGGDYSEMYMLDKNGNLAKTEEDIAEFRIVEKKADGTVIRTTYALPQQ